MSDHEDNILILKEEYAKMLKDAKRLVIKVGTSTITHATGKLNINRMDMLAMEIADLVGIGKEIIFVTSGAVGAGMGRLALKAKPNQIAKKQALAAVGQGLLMQAYEKLFSEYGVDVAQILLTKEDIADKHRYTNAKNTLEALFDYGVLPIINENDTVAFEEIKVGDNDTLAALIAGLAEADLLVLLSDIDGLYTADPRTNPEAKLISVVEELTPEIYAAAGAEGSKLATGGMSTKLAAAAIARENGIPMVLANGSRGHILENLVEGICCGTLFLPKIKA